MPLAGFDLMTKVNLSVLPSFSRCSFLQLTVVRRLAATRSPQESRARTRTSQPARSLHLNSYRFSTILQPVSPQTRWSTS